MNQQTANHLLLLRAFFGLRGWPCPCCGVESPAPRELIVRSDEWIGFMRTLDVEEVFAFLDMLEGV